MSLVEISIPVDDADDDWQDQLASRVLLLLLGALFFRLGFRFWAGVERTGLASAIPTWGAFAAGIQLLILSVADIDLERWGRPLAYGITAFVTVLVIATLLVSGSQWIPRLNTDALTFSSYSVELLVGGVNPYSASMAPARGLFGTGQFWTRRTDGSLVMSLSYPAGSVLAYLPQYALLGRGPIGIRLTSILVVPAIATVVIHALPPRLSLLGPISLWWPRSQWLTAAGGIVDMLWALPTVLAVVLWARDRRVAAAVALGVACGTKQHPWLVLPFLAVWVWHESDSLSGFVREAATLNAAGLAGFGALNLPFILWNPRAWLSGVFTPLGSDGAPLVVKGVGLAVFRLAGVAIPRWVFTAAVAVVGVASLAAYWRWFERLRWAGWLAPMPILLVHSRSLVSYFVWWVPVGVVALVALHGRIRGQRVPSGGIVDA